MILGRVCECSPAQSVWTRPMYAGNYEGREGVIARIPGEGGVDEIQQGIVTAL